MASKVKPRKGRLEIWKSKKNKQFYWRFCASNGRITAVGGEGYKVRAMLVRTLKSMGVKLATGMFEIVEA